MKRESIEGAYILTLVCEELPTLDEIAHLPEQEQILSLSTLC